MENFKIDFGNLKIDQLGFVFKDIEKQAELMQNILGLPKFIFTEPMSNTIQYRGKESQLTSQIAISRLGITQIELIKWISGECSYKEFLDQGKEGLHHIMIDPDDPNSLVDDFKNKGVKVLLEVEEIKATYFDTEESLGINLEIIGR